MCFARDDRAASEVVGAIMLITIVVVASASFATFLLDKQETIQENERHQLNKDLEAFQFQDIELVDTDADNDWDEITFHVQPLHTKPFMIQTAELDDEVLKEFTLTRTLQASPNQYRIVADDDPAALEWDASATIGTADWADVVTRLELGAREPFSITINLRETGASPAQTGDYTPTEDSTDFYGGTPPTVADTAFFELAFTTGFLNEVKQAFIPPDASVDIALDCTLDLFTFEVEDVVTHGLKDFVGTFAWMADNLNVAPASDPAAGNGRQYTIDFSPYTDGDPIQIDLTMTMASGVKGSWDTQVTIPTGCI